MTRGRNYNVFYIFPILQYNSKTFSFIIIFYEIRPCIVWNENGGFVTFVYLLIVVIERFQNPSNKSHHNAIHSKLSLSILESKLAKKQKQLRMKYTFYREQNTR